MTARGPSWKSWLYRAGLAFTGVFYIFAGVNHFWHTPMYTEVMPPYVPAPLAMIYFTGVAEVLGGVGLWVPFARRAAACGLVALLICVWPAHVHMLLHAEQFTAIPVWGLWLRLLLQPPLIFWAWWYTRNRLANS